MRQPQLLGEQVERGVAHCGLFARGLQVPGGALQRQHMALAGDVDALGRGLPAGALQQRLGIVILAYVLGGIFERSVRQALAISDGDLAIFVSTPLTIAFAVITAILVVIAFIPRRVIGPRTEKQTALDP